MSGYDLEALQVSAAYRLEARLAEHVAAAERRIWRHTPTEILNGELPTTRIRVVPLSRPNMSGLDRLGQALVAMGDAFALAAVRFKAATEAAHRQAELTRRNQGPVCSCRYGGKGPCRACKL